MEEKLIDKITKILELTRSSNDHEALLSSRMANSILDTNNLRWPDILKSRIEIKIIEKAPAPTDYNAIFEYIDQYCTSDHSLEFSNSLKDFYSKRGYLTEKQAIALYGLYQKIRGFEEFDNSDPF